MPSITLPKTVYCLSRNEASFLDKQYTVFGKVIEGMEFVDKIKRGEPASEPDKIISFK